MPDLEMSLTYEERIKLFQDRLYKVIKTVGKKKGSPGQLKLSDLLPDKDENTLSGKMHYYQLKYQ